ncbi:MAG: VWA domain-containing protein [Chloroflexi bacterium]|nr:VWA domain-containing protein [Chloroflexota bacterium]
MSFLTPLAFIGALLAAPIILLYMLRLRRREVPISSNFLWQQILQDNEANTPWQRLRRNLLLILQLIILALLIFALARPFILVPAVSSGQTAVLIDASASMNATDTSGGTRFDAAKAEALDIVDTMGPGDTVTVIRVADAPEVLSPYSADQGLLRAAINGAQPSRASADWNAALTLAAAGAAGAEDFNVVIIGDGGVGDTAQLPAIPGELRFVPVGSASDNLAISALATRSLPGADPQMFAQITNYGPVDTEVIFNLRVDGELFTAENYVVPAGGDLPVVSSALPLDFQTIQAGLTLPAAADQADFLPEDNRAFAVSGTGGARSIILMTPGNLFIEQVLRSLPAVEVFRGDIQSGLLVGDFDSLYIFDRWLPNQLPADNDMLIIAPPNATPLFTVGGTISETTNPRVRREDPRMTFVDFDNVNILAFNEVTAEWADELIVADGGPLLLAGEVDGRQIAILTFDLRDSDLPLQIAWPVLMSSLLDWFAPQTVVSAPEGLSVGETLTFTPLPESESVRITLPDGATRSFNNTGRPIIFAETDQTGLYTVEVLLEGDVIDSGGFAVNLFDSGESDITPQPTFNIGQTVIGQAEAESIGQREFWPLLALLALLVLLIEWYLYQRRQRLPRAPRPAPRPGARTTTPRRRAAG